MLRNVILDTNLLAPALPQLPELRFQRLTRRLRFPQTVLRLLQTAFGVPTRLRLFQRLASFPVSPQVLPAHRIIKVQRLP